MASVILRPPIAADLQAVRELLARAALPLAGLEDFFGSGYVVAIPPAGAPIGVAGVEVYGWDGLLRSVAVAPSARGTGVGNDLVRDRIAWSRTQRLSGLHLLTTTARDYFARRGFQVVDRGTLPAGIRGSIEFSQACPESAVAMSLVL
jgi:amino-acid N-acetyltransferase